MRDYYRRVNGYYRRLEDRHLEPTRWLGWLLVCSNLPPEDRPELEDMWPLRKDKLRVLPPVMSEEEYRAAMARLDELDADLLPPKP